METLLNESLWGDEGFSALAVQKPFVEMMGVVMRDTAPPLFYIVGFVWSRLFGFSEVALRSLSLILMLGAAWFAYKIVAFVGKDRLVAVAAGLLTLLSPFLVPFAFEWRMYALLSFVVTGSVYFFVARKWKGYVLFTTAALYTHHYALFTVAGQGLWFLMTEFNWREPRTFLKQLWPFWLVVALYVPWLFPMYRQITRVKGAGFWLSVPTIREVGNLLYRFATGGVTERWRPWVMILVGLIAVGKDWVDVGKKWIELLVVFLMPVVLAFVVSQVLTPIFYDRYLLSVVVGMAVLIVVGTKEWARSALISILLIYVYLSVTVFLNPVKRPFRELATYIKSSSEVGDYLINFNGKAHHLWESKYYGTYAPIYTPEGPLPLYVGTAQMTDEDTINRIPQDVERLGVISSDPVENIVLPAKWDLTEVVEFEQLKVAWFE